jgi:lysozyme family protein
MLFKDAVQHILDLEGGDLLVDHPRDPGGLTKYGILIRAWPELGREGIANLTEEQAIAIYRRHYWDVIGIDRLPERLRLAVFDSAVNQGPDTAAELLQRALCRLGAKLHVDGDIGPRTLAALRNYPSSMVLSSFLLERLRHYEGLKTFKTFGFGWKKRIIEIAIAS